MYGCLPYLEVINIDNTALFICYININNILKLNTMPLT